MVRKKKNFRDDWYDPFRDFDRMRRMMERLIEDMFMGFDMDDLEKLSHDPHAKVYGFSVRVGPDGKPIIREFGNIRPSRISGPPRDEPALTDAREPLIDVFESKDGKTVNVIAELPGVDKSDIDLKIKGNTLIIHSKNKERKYHKEIELPDVDPEHVKATYKNGVLSIEFKRINRHQTKTRRIKIE